MPTDMTPAAARGQRPCANGRTGAPPGGLAARVGNAAWLRPLAIAAAGGVFLGVAGPFGSYLNGSRPVVIGYWVACLLAGWPLYGLATGLALRLARRWHLPAGWGWIAGSLGGAAGLALLSRRLAIWLWPGIPAWVGPGTWLAQTILVGLPITALVWWTHCDPPAVPAEPAAPAAGSPPLRFTDRLPPALGTEVLALQMEDHYVRAHTPRGSVLVLVPLHQAMQEVAELDGLQVHRSWWVARQAVRGCRQDGRNLRLVLSNGIEAPVSRANVARVRSEGWLA